MSDGIALTANQRATLLSLSTTATLYTRTQTRLNTGKKINSASDDAVAYYRSQVLYDRATNLTTIKTNIDQNISALNTAETTTAAVGSLLQQLKAVVESARSSSGTASASATTQFKDLANQLAQLVEDSTYQGLNILTSSNASLNTQLSDRTAATFHIPGFNLVETAAGNQYSLFTQTSNVFNAGGTLNFSALVGDASGVSGSPSNAVPITSFTQLSLTAPPSATIPGSIAEVIFTATSARIDKALNQLQSITASIGTSVGILTSRSTFTANYSNDLTTGADKLTLADLNTEAANSQSLELRQQLGIQSLSVSATMNQSVLQLLK